MSIMADFKIGQKVEGVLGGKYTVTANHGDGRYDIRSDRTGKPFTDLSLSGFRASGPPPLRFEDVRTGDKATVEGTDGQGNPFTVSGMAELLDSGNLWVGDTYILVNTSILTAHTPAEPEWHRAQVIKAEIEGIARINPAVHLIWSAARGGWVSPDLRVWSHDDLINVKIVVDEHGQVRA